MIFGVELLFDLFQQFAGALAQLVVFRVVEEDLVVDVHDVFNRLFGREEKSKVAITALTFLAGFNLSAFNSSAFYLKFKISFPRNFADPVEPWIRGDF